MDPISPSTRIPERKRRGPLDLPPIARAQEKRWEVVQYADVRSSIRDFDLLLCRGKSPLRGGSILGWIIRRFTGGPDHVMVAKWLHAKEGGESVLMAWETSPTKFPDAGGTMRKGVRLVTLSERLRSYKGEISWRPIHGPRTPEMEDRFLEVRRNLEGLPYETNLWELIGASLRGKSSKKRWASALSLFCSELTAHTEKAVGILGEPKVRDSAYTPEDFSIQADRELGWRYPWEADGIEYILRR